MNQEQTIEDSLQKAGSPITMAAKAACLLVLLLCLLCPAFAASSPPPVRISVWYWLNSAPATQWQTDFKAIRSLGFTDVVLVWGLDATAFSTRIPDSHRALRAAHAAGLGGYLFVWHARHSALPHERRFEQVDAAGHALYAFDAFNPQWRGTQWKTYLQTLAREYGPEPALAGYVFDNSFAIGNIGSIDGPAPRPEDSYISYGDAERTAFARRLPISPQDPAWKDWTSARQQWWADWATDTRAAIRAIDPNPVHRIVLEDGENTIDPDTETRVGLNLGRVIPSFDTMSAYWAPSYSDPQADRQLESGIKDYLLRVRGTIGPHEDLALSLRLSESATEDLPGSVSRPTLEQIKRAIDTALAMGVRRIDLYGYRMGIYHLDGPGWLQYRPGSGKTYPLTGQITGKFLCDRPDLWPGLRAYLHQIQTADGRPVQAGK